MGFGILLFFLIMGAVIKRYWPIACVICVVTGLVGALVGISCLSATVLTGALVGIGAGLIVSAVLAAIVALKSW